jgi:hypothetical protein
MFIFKLLENICRFVEAVHTRMMQNIKQHLTLFPWRWLDLQTEETIYQRTEMEVYGLMANTK